MMTSVMTEIRTASTSTSNSTTSEEACPGGSGTTRKRTREMEEPCCSGGCGNPQCNAKKSVPLEEDSSPENDPNGRIRWWYVKLDSETENYDSDTPDSLKYESTWSIQDYDTEVVQDSEDDLSDDESRWKQQHRLELELATDHSSEEGPFQRRGNCSSSSSSDSSDLEVGSDRSLSPLDR